MESQENEFEVVEYMLKKLSNTFYSHIPTFLLKNKSKLYHVARNHLFLSFSKRKVFL